MSARKSIFLNSLLLACALVLPSCDDSAPKPVDAGSFPDWQVRSATSLGFNEEKLQDVFDYVAQPDFNTQGIVIIKDGYLAAEWYAKKKSADSWATSWSVAKSFASATIGILYDDGLITSLDLPMTTWVPEWSGTERAEIKLRDVLTMSSGLDWDETYNLTGGEPSDVVNMVLGNNPLSTVVERPVTSDAGSSFVYSSGDTMLLSRIIRQVSGKNATALAGERLFEPLGMTQVDWWEDSHGETYTFCCLDTTSRNFAKFGQLFLQGGLWGGRQVLSKEWVQMSIGETANSNPGYGLQWWLNVPNDELHHPSVPHDAYFALGHDTQTISVFPTQNMVVVRNGLYVKPEGPAIAETDLFSAGLISDGLGSTGSSPPQGDWSDETFLSLVLAALDE